MTQRAIEPQPGPQTAFAQCPADIAIYGGAAGGGKSWGVMFEGLRGCQISGYRAVIFRKALTDITEPGALWDESRELYAPTGAKPRGGQYLDWRWPSGARIGFAYLDKEGDELRYQGAAFAYIAFDELTHIREKAFWYLWSRNRSTCGIRPYMRATCNPDADSWVRQLIDWWIGADGYPIPERSGVLRWFIRDGDAMHWADSPEELVERFPDREPKSLTFIAAKLEDNPALTTKDPHYQAILESMPAIDRERLLKGNWNIRPVAGSYFKRQWFRVVDLVAAPVLTVRAWDLAATEETTESPDPDWTAGVKMSLLRDGRTIVEDVQLFRAGPGEVEARMRRTAQQDGRGVRIGLWQDPGSAGKLHAEHLQKNVLRGFVTEVVVAARNKEAYAKPLSAAADPAVEPGAQVVLLRGSWHAAFLGQLEGFPGKGHDDAVDAASLAYLLLSGRASAVARYRALAS